MLESQVPNPNLHTASTSFENEYDFLFDTALNLISAARNPNAAIPLPDLEALHSSELLSDSIVGRSLAPLFQVGSALFEAATLDNATTARASTYSESNDILGEAIATGIDNTSPQYQVNGIIGDNPAVDSDLDVDLFAVDLIAGDRLTIDIDADSVGSTLDSTLRVFDDAGNELVWSDSDVAPGETWSLDPYIDFLATTDGTYYIGVSSDGNYYYDPTVVGSGTPGVATGDYTLDINLSTMAMETSNDTLDTATTQTVGYDNPVQIDGFVGDNAAVVPGLDVDLYAVNLTAGDRLTIDIDAETLGSSLDSGLRIFDDAGNELALSDDDAAPGESYSFDSYLDFTALATGTYYIGVSGFWNFDYNPNTAGSGLELGSTGSYSLELIRSQATLETSNDTLDTATATNLSISNNQFQTAATIGDNALFLSEPGVDVDVYSFYLNAGDQVTIDVDADEFGGSLDSGLRLFDASGNELDWSDDDAAPGESYSFDPYLDFTADASGMYFLGVSGYYNYRYDPNAPGSGVAGSTGDYDLSISLNAYAYEANDSMTQAIFTGFNSDNPGTGQISGVIGDSPNLAPSNDVDFFMLQLDEGDRLTVDVDAFEEGSWLDSGLRLFDANGNEVAFSDDDAAPGESLSYDPYLEFTALTSGNYYLGISGYGNLDYDPFWTDFSTTAGSTGAYEMTLSLTSFVDEGNDTLTQATTTGLGPSSPGSQEYLGAIGDNPAVFPDLDVDMFSVQMDAGDTLVLDVDADEVGSLLDAGLRVFDAYGNELAWSDDDPAPGESFSFDPYLEFVAPAAGNYFIGVSSFDNFDYDPFVAGSGDYGYTTGDYSLEMTLLPAEDTTDPINPDFNSIWGYGAVDAAAAVATATGAGAFADVADLGGNFWGLDNINAPEVWNQGYTGDGVVVAVLDTGVDYTHSDLDDNIWMNAGEIAGDGIDNDGNGFIDDVYGWDFVSDDGDPMDGDTHGTHVAGTIAAENNGFGMTGVAYNAQIMPVRVIGDEFEQSDYDYLDDIAQGIYYAVDNGADVINMSLGYVPFWVGGSDSPYVTAVENAIQYASDQGTVVVMAAGNEYANQPGDPANNAIDWGLAVGAVDINNQMAIFSNYAGTTPLDYIVGPGVDVYSTIPGESYDFFSGTSMAAPHVAGVAALVMEADPTLTAPEVEDILTGSANPTGITV